MRDFHLKRILVPTDLSPSSIIALRYARLFAERFSAGLTAFYVGPLVATAKGFGDFARLENDIFAPTPISSSEEFRTRTGCRRAASVRRRSASFASRACRLTVPQTLVDVRRIAPLAALWSGADREHLGDDREHPDDCSRRSRRCSRRFHR